MPNMRRAALLLLTTLALAAFAGCRISVGDQACTEESNVNDKEDSCPYGSPGGPKVIESGCPDITQESDPALCTVSWTDVYAILSGPTAACTLNGCHGAKPGARGIYLPADDATTFYDSLKEYNGSQGYPYINEQQHSHSWILCNLGGVPGGGAPMPPPSGLDETDLATITQWAACGFPKSGGDAGP